MSAVTQRCQKSYYGELHMVVVRRRGMPRKSWKDNINEWTREFIVVVAAPRRLQKLMGDHYNEGVCRSTPTTLGHHTGV